MAHDVLDNIAERARLGLQAAEGLHGHHVGQRILRAAGQRRMGPASARRCPVWVRRMTNRVTLANTVTSATSTSDRRQFRNALSGSSTTTAT